MGVRANSSRERILASAEEIILQKGFSATSIEDILDKAAITKGGFFFHFGDRGELARALVERYLVADEAFFGALFEQADDLSEDPLQQLLIFLKLLAKAMSEMESTHPGCLVASFTYESQQFDDSIRALIKTGILSWRHMIAQRLDAIGKRYQPVSEIDREALADMFTSNFEGGIILSRILQNNKYLVDQILAYRDHLRLVFNQP